MEWSATASPLWQGQCGLFSLRRPFLAKSPSKRSLAIYSALETQFSVAKLQKPNPLCSPKQPHRPLANFHPDIWGDHFLNYTSPPQESQLQRDREIKELKEEVRKKLLNVGNDPKERIMYIDAIEQLGVAYHFEEDIEAILQQMFHKCYDNDDLYDNDLSYISLSFRILRQHGYIVSCGVFDKFKNEMGSFKESIKGDVGGLLNLYEASYLRVHGEQILEEALEFTKSELKSMVDESSEPLATQVSQALTFPIHKSLRRLSSRCYINTYETNPLHDKTLLRFAKLDFNVLQSLHLKELRDLTRWWKGFDFGNKLPFTRDRIVEAYLWAMGTFYEPQYAMSRAMFTKLVKLLTTIDDTYDAYGLLEELELFTEAIERWDKSCMDKLPDYMKLIYEYVLDTFDGFEQELAKEGRSHVVSYVRKQMAVQCKSYLQEVKWMHEKQVPTYEEYIKVGAITICSTILCSVAFLGMGEVATEEVMEWVSQTPKLVSFNGVIGRLMDDLAGHKVEQNRNHVASAVECYALQYGVSKEEAANEIWKKVDETWKDLNQGMLRTKNLPRCLLNAILNFTRLMQDYYGHGVDNYTVVDKSMKDKVRAILIDPVLL